MKKKGVAATLAFFLGIFGVHRFYLGQKVLGIIYFVLFFIGLAAAVDGEEFPLIAIPALIGFVDAVVFAVMPREDFDEKYNRKWLYDEEKRTPARHSRRRHPAPSFSPDDQLQYYKRSGIDKFRDYDYEGAVEDFERALEIKFETPSLHFNLACCYSILEEAEKSFYHLENAIAFGFNDLAKIHNHDALSFLRATAEFDRFVANDYRRPVELPLPADDLLSGAPTPPPEKDNLLEQIKRLGELRDQGILTNEEFTLQKKKLLQM